MKKVLGAIVFLIFIIAASQTSPNRSSNSSDEEPQQEQTTPKKKNKSKKVKNQVQETEATDETPAPAEPEYSNNGDEAVDETEGSEYIND